MVFNEMGDISQICKEISHTELPSLFVRFKRHIIRLVWLSFWLSLRLATEISLLAANQNKFQPHRPETHSCYEVSVHAEACVFVRPAKSMCSCWGLSKPAGFSTVLPEMLPFALAAGKGPTILLYKVTLPVQLICVFKDVVFLFISPHVIITKKLHPKEFILYKPLN